MKKLVIPALALTVVHSTAFAAPGTASGPSALALAAVTAQHSPAVRAFDKRVIARLFRGNTRFGFTPNTKIPVDAGLRVRRRRQGRNTAGQRRLHFRGAQRTLTRRDGKGVGANNAGAGNSSRGRGGSSIESVSKLRCTIDP